MYHLSIIDYLQKWNFDKILENKTKTWLLQKSATKLSAVEPNFYRDRYVAFMDDNVILAQTSPVYDRLFRRQKTKTK